MRVALPLLLGVSMLSCSVHSALAQSAVPQRLTEAQALQRLDASDPRATAARARIEERRALQAERVLWPNPSVTFSRESAGTHDEFVLGRQELPLTGRLARLREAGRYAVEAAEAEGQLQRIQLQADVRDAFTLLLLAQEREAVIVSAIAELQRLLEILRAREAGGEGSTYDRLRGQRALVDLEAERGAAAAERVRARGRLAGVLGTPVEQALVADGVLEAPAPLDVTPALARALERPDFKALTLYAEQYRAERAAAKRLALPTPTLTGGLKRSTAASQTHSGYLFSFDVSLPLFNRGRAALAGANAQQVRYQADAEVLRRQIDAEVRAAHEALVIQHERAAQYRAATGETLDSFVQTARIGYEEGELGILELLDAVRVTLEGRLRLLDLAAAARRAAIELDRVSGLEIRP